ncbi:hypothetical protein D8S78_23525 [Natrialba swarupiae]|nr:hypothetical protein [Natrialba swarupiae]
MKHITAEDLAERQENQDSDVTTVFDEDAMVIEQSRYRAEKQRKQTPRHIRKTNFIISLLDQEK